MATATNRRQATLVDRMLDVMERLGNRLPQPTTMFALLALAVVVLSTIAAWAGAAVDVPTVNQAGQREDVRVAAKALISEPGVHFMLEKAVTNFTGFAPMGIVLVALFGIAAAEGTGLLETAVRRAMMSIPRSLVTASIVFIGVNSNIASDAGYVVVVPMGAVIFAALRRPPLAGICAGFVGVSGGFSANLLIGSIDPLLGDMSTKAARVLEPDYSVSPMANYYFMFASVFLVTLIGTLVTQYVVEPRLARDAQWANSEVQVAGLEPLTAEQRRGLKAAGWALLVSVLLLVVALIPRSSWLRNAETGSILEDSPFIRGIVIIITILFFIPGVVYGRFAGTARNDKELLDKMAPTVSAMGGYLILTFMAAQFVAYFSYSNLGTILAVWGADVLKATGLTGIPLLVLFIFVTGLINLLIGSTVTKWAMMAGVFVPMFMLVGVSPELTQLAFRVGDSSTHIISPLMPFFGVVLAVSERWYPKIRLGTLLTNMLPYSVALILGWSLFTVIWVLLGLPIGPGSQLFLR